MNTQPTRSKNPEGGISRGTNAMDDMSGNRRPATVPRILGAALLLIAAGVAIYFLAINPRVQNAKHLRAVAAAAGKTTVTVVKPTQTSSAPELILPGNVKANQMTSIYSRVDGYIKKWYVDIGAHVQQGQILADIEAPEI